MANNLAAALAGALGGARDFRRDKLDNQRRLQEQMLRASLEQALIAQEMEGREGLEQSKAARKSEEEKAKEVKKILDELAKVIPQATARGFEIPGGMEPDAPDALRARLMDVRGLVEATKPENRVPLPDPEDEERESLKLEKARVELENARLLGSKRVKDLSEEDKPRYREFNGAVYKETPEGLVPVEGIARKVHVPSKSDFFSMTQAKKSNFEAEGAQGSPEEHVDAMRRAARELFGLDLPPGFFTDDFGHPLGLQPVYELLVDDYKASNAARR